MQNYNCDGAHCQRSNGETRFLPTSGGANIILCKSCYFYELNWRREENKRLSGTAKYDLPDWGTLKLHSDSE